MGKHPIFSPYFILMGLIGFSLLSGFINESLGFQQNIEFGKESPLSKDSLIIQNRASEQQPATASEGALLAQNKLIPESTKIINVMVTAYSSSLDETDETPFLTASGAGVGEGVAAANFLPLGTKLKLPDLFGDQIFVIEDRLHSRFNDRIDIWMASKEEAKEFGQKISRVEIIENNVSQLLTYGPRLASNN